MGPRGSAARAAINHATRAPLLIVREQAQNGAIINHN
jgi:hypothetical protein